MKQFGLSLFPVAISAGLMTMLLLLIIMPSSTNGIEITVMAEQKITKESNLINVVVNGLSTVKELKEQINEKIGIEPEKQTLKLKQNGPEMEDEKRLTDYGIGNGTTIHLSFEKLQIFVKYKNGDEAEEYTVWMNGTDTVKILKQKMNNCSGIEVEGQTLKLKKSGGSVELEDDKKLDFYGFVPKLAIHLSIEKIQIFVKYKKNGDDEKEYTVWVKDMDTVATLKQKIMEMTAIETGQQTLKFQKSDGSVTELDDVKKFVFYGIVPNSTIRLSTESFKILVKYKKGYEEEIQYTVWVKDMDTVATLKQKIIAMMQNELNTLIEDIGLSCSPTVEATVKAKDRLNNDSKTMEEYGIKEGKCIYILHAFVQRPEGDNTREKSQFELVYYI